MAFFVSDHGCNDMGWNLSYRFATQSSVSRRDWHENYPAEALLPTLNFAVDLPYDAIR